MKNKILYATVIIIPITIFIFTTIIFNVMISQQAYKMAKHNVEALTKKEICK